MTPAPTDSAYLKLKPEQCTVTDVAQISKEYLNIEEDLIMLDTNGFEILDNPDVLHVELSLLFTNWKLYY